MEVNELPQFDPNVDYNLILPIQQKRTIAFVNHFVMNTVSFLNNFYESCESRLMEFEYKLQKVEASLLILEAQLTSIPDIDVPIVGVTENDGKEQVLDLPEISNDNEDDISKEENVREEKSQEEEKKVMENNGPKASEDPRFKKFFKMMQFGVPPQAVKLKMVAEGVDPDILEKPNDVIPGYSPLAETSDTTTTNSTESN